MRACLENKLGESLMRKVVAAGQISNGSNSNSLPSCHVHFPFIFGEIVTSEETSLPTSSSFATDWAKESVRSCGWNSMPGCGSSSSLTIQPTVTGLGKCEYQFHVHHPLAASAM